MLVLLIRAAFPFVLACIVAWRMLASAASRWPVQEGLVADGDGRGQQYKPPPLSDDPLYLAKLNAANISYLNTRTSDFSKLSSDVADLKKQVANNSAALAKIAVESQKALGGNAPSQPASIPAKYRN
jgi:hypothetical protein